MLHICLSGFIGHCICECLHFEFYKKWMPVLLDIMFIAGHFMITCQMSCCPTRGHLATLLQDCTQRLFVSNMVAFRHLQQWQEVCRLPTKLFNSLEASSPKFSPQYSVQSLSREQFSISLLAFCHLHYMLHLRCGILLFFFLFYCSYSQYLPLLSCRVFQLLLPQSHFS